MQFIRGGIIAVTVSKTNYFVKTIFLSRYLEKAMLAFKGARPLRGNIQAQDFRCLLSVPARQHIFGGSASPSTGTVE